MRKLEICTLLLIGALGGCMTAAPMPAAGPSGAPGGEAGASDPGATSGRDAALFTPMLIDRSDLALGTTVEFHHLPSVGELLDAAEQFAIRHVVVMLPGWPQGSADLSRFSSLPAEADVIVLLPGYPPDRSALDAWNYARGRVRLIVLVDGPPANPGQLDDLNTLRALERVVARMPHPSRSGFEHLQRPLSFVVAGAE